ncbi:sugar phosphate isomerase/epimerase family protein [Microbacterium resistens]
MAMYLGLANGDIPAEPAGFTEALISSWASLGIRCLSVHFSAGPAAVVNKVADLRSRLSAGGIHVAQMAGVNANFVHPSAEVRAEAHRRVIAAIPTAVGLGATMISSGAGTSRNDWTRAFYGPHPDNYSARAADDLITGLRGIAPHIEDAGLSYTVECHQLSTMRSAEVIREVMDAVDSPVISANFDPVNLLDSAVAVYDNAARMRHIMDVVGPRYGASCHVKDVVVTDEFVCRTLEVPPGDGVLDYDAFFEVVRRLPDESALIVEHLTPEQTAGGVRFVRERALAAGIELL